MGVYEKLMHVQSGLKAPKSQFNKFGNYYYRNCEDIQEAAKPLMREVKAALIVGDELVQMDNRFYIKATASFIDCETGEKVCNSAYAREELEKKGMDASQVTGSSSSYARKYALNGLFCIDDVKDADNQDDTGTGKKATGNAKAGQKRADNVKPGQKSEEGVSAEAKQPPGSGKGQDENTERILAEKIDQAKFNVVIGELKRTGVEEKVILGLFGLKKLEDMNNGQFITVMKKFKATPSKEGQ